MNIRKTLIAVIAVAGIAQVQANPLARVVTGIAKNPNLKTRLFSGIKNTIKTDIVEPLQTDFLLIKESFKATKIGRGAQQLFESCIANETARKIAIFKTIEYVATMPGFILAAHGDTQALIGAVMTLNHYGIHGLALNAALLSGAASYHAFQFGLNQYEKIKENMKKRHAEKIDADLNLWSL